MNKNVTTLVAFDLDGTLIDSAKDFHNCLNLLTKKHNEEEIEYTEVRERVSEGSFSLIKHVFKGSSEKRTNLLREELLDLYEENCLLKTIKFEGADSLIQYLESEKIKWCIVTNKPRRFAEKIVKHFFPSLDHKKMLFCPDEFIEPKPSPRGLNLACKNTNSDPSSSFFVGDHAIDIEAGRRAGIHTIAVDYGYRKIDDLVENWNANFTVGNLCEIKNLIHE